MKVLDVTIDQKTNTAFLKTLLIPEKVWNYQDYIKERQNISNVR